MARLSAAVACLRAVHLIINGIVGLPGGLGRYLHKASQQEGKCGGIFFFFFIKLIGEGGVEC